MNRDLIRDFLPSSLGLTGALEDLLAFVQQPPQAEDATLELPSVLPDAGVGSQSALKLLQPSALGGARRLCDPGFFAHMDPPTPWVTWAAAQWAAALNQNLLHPETAPSARSLESRVVDWLAPFFGMDGGHVVPGSTVANLTGLWVARELRNVQEVVASEAAHLSVRKAADLLGLRYRAVPVDEFQRLRPGRLGNLNRSALVLTAGTVAAGAIDPLDAGVGPAWRHIDAAWAGPLKLSHRHAHLLDGIEEADSVAFSPHKWLFQPKECGIILFRDTAIAHRAVTYSGGYLAAPNVGLLGSHGAAALPLAATLLAWGRSGIATLLDHCMSLAERLADRVESDPALELFRRPMTGIVLRRPRGAEVHAAREVMSGAFVATAAVGDQTWFRSVAANPMADPDLVVDRVLNAISDRAGRW